MTQYSIVNKKKEQITQISNKNFVSRCDKIKAKRTNYK